ncbi:MAG: glycosyltransferase [Gammaproteobacteria bacterium]|nr:glycosyltransferase [Gammaproteobacteria bacterium]
MHTSGGETTFKTAQASSLETDFKVAVVIVNYNGGDYILSCLDSLYLQSRKPDEIIVVDNNSTDGSPEKLAQRFPSVNLQVLDRNTGFAAANNHAFELLRNNDPSCWVALLNPDTRPQADWLSKLMEAVSKNPEVDVFGSKLIWSEDNDILDGQGDIHHVSGLSWRRHHGLRWKEALELRTSNEMAFSPCGAAALYRTDKVNEIGGMDKSYFCYHEDVDIMFRLRLVGATFVYVNDSVVEHVGSAITGKNSDFSVFYGHRNLVWTYIKNMPSWLFWLYLPQHLLLNVLTILIFSCKGRGKIILKSKWEAVKGIPLAIRKRRVIQGQRTVSNAVIWRSLSKGWLKPYFFRRK